MLLKTIIFVTGMLFVSVRTATTDPATMTPDQMMQNLKAMEEFIRKMPEQGQSPDRKQPDAAKPNPDIKPDNEEKAWGIPKGFFPRMGIILLNVFISLPLKVLKGGLDIFSYLSEVISAAISTFLDYIPDIITPKKEK